MDRASLVGRAVMIGASLLLAAVLARVVWLQVSPDPRLAERIDERVRARTLPAVRGELVDRRGRVLSTTRLARRIVIDPTQLGDRVDEVITVVSDRLGLPPDELGMRVYRAIADNSAIEQAGEGTRSRYLPIDLLLTADESSAILAEKLPGVWAEVWPVRAVASSELMGSVVGKVGFGHTGLLGAELAFERELTGENGSIRFVRDARGRPLWIERGGVQPSDPGRSVRLSLDLEIQRIAMRELVRGVEEADGQGGRIVVLDPITGEVLAMGDVYREAPDAIPFPWVPKDVPYGADPIVPPEGERPRYRILTPDPRREIHPALGRNRVVEDVYEPGSTMKPFVWATALTYGRLEEGETLPTGKSGYMLPYGRRVVRDVSDRRDLDWDGVLVHSSNVGMSIAAARLSHDELREAVVRFGFGQPTGIGLPGEATGVVTSPKNWSDYTQTSVSFGYEVAVTPLQMARAFSLFARSGDLAGSLPMPRLVAVPGGEASYVPAERVLPAWSVERTRAALEVVARRMDERRQLRHPDDPAPIYPMFGKSGTTEVALAPPDGMRRPEGVGGYLKEQHVSSFVAAGPTDDPRLVVLAIIDDPGPGMIAQRRHFGSETAGPVVRRVMDGALRYLGEPAPPNAELVSFER